MAWIDPKGGRWAEQGPKEAARLFELASEKGVAGAEYELGVCYANGEGAEKDLAKAMLALSHCYRDGVGTKKGDGMALHYLHLGADSGCQEAIDLLAEMESENKSAH